MTDEGMNYLGSLVRGIVRTIGSTRYVEPVVRVGGGNLVASRFNVAQPAAGASLLATSITIAREGRLVVGFSCSVANTTPKIQRTVGAVTVDEKLDWGVALPADTYHEQSFIVDDGDAINFECDTTGGTYTIRVLDPEGVV